MGALFLGDQEILRATLSRAEVEPREILKECLLRGTAGVVLFHTHPSGDPTPSDADLLLRFRMAYAATLVGVELVDHLVLGAIGCWVSIKAQGGWLGSPRQGLAGLSEAWGGLRGAPDTGAPGCRPQATLTWRRRGRAA
jgi:RadC-like JAB domain